MEKPKNVMKTFITASAQSVCVHIYMRVDEWGLFVKARVERDVGRRS